MNLRIHALVAASAFFLTAVSALACPFCSVESQTLSEETKGADAVVLAKLVKEAPQAADTNDPNSGMATFQIVEALKGQEALGIDKEIKVVYFGDSDHNKTFMITGLGKGKIDWTTPLPLTPAAVAYVKKLSGVAPAGIERLVFFQDYLEHEDPLLSQDSYDEFGRAPYSELRELKPKMQHDRIVKWVADPEVSPSRRRLYLTMLGVCGTKADVPLLEGMIASNFDEMKPALVELVGTGISMGGPIGMPVLIEAVQQDERRKKLGLDALIACYLILRGPDGMDLVENRFLKNPHAEYTHVYSTIMALRFHGDENTGVVPRERLLGAMRLLLTNPDFADQVILDLSRWEDWSVMDQMVDMFKKSDAKGYVRQPVVSYLTVASEQDGDVGTRAKAALADLEKLDPETVKTARSLMAFGALGRARGAAAAAGAAAKNGATTAADAPAATASTTVDTAQAFAASADDEKTDTSHIPDPATFGAQGPEVKAAVAARPAVAAGAPITSVSREATVGPPKVSLLLVAGLPLAAAVVLMGVYWLILKAGAV
ncbi:MAG TPA: hypothetical protein VHU84_06410 [Lacipirellulaceae bacterium]|jgi:hypothetical protein|nr:hypothetical protein [Lacipirellulaceae bacterium]